MGLISKLRDIFNRIKNRNNDNKLDFLNEFLDEKEIKQLPTPEADEHIYETIELPENELVSFSDEVLDTESKVSIQKFQHNLKILVQKAKEKGKIDKFMLIREDDFFPTDWEWRVNSKNTNLEKEPTSLSCELRKAYALEQSGIDPFIELFGMKIPNGSTSDEKTMEALSKVDRTYGNVLLPSRFRSTKHFTINTPLGATGAYNFVETNRNFIIIDNMDAFLESEYAYSVAYRDAYLDISHESLPISEEAIVLINDEKYDKIMSDEKVASQLAQRRVVRFKGDELIATNMILTEMGALPSTVGSLYAIYDNDLHNILDSSIQNLAGDNGLLYQKSHAGREGHFSSYYDDKNQDYQMATKEFINFLREKFPEERDLFPEYLTLTNNISVEIVERLGTARLSEAINEYNELASNRAVEKLEEYKKDRQTITPEIHQQFVDTVALINDFYKTEVNYKSYEEKIQIENAIQKFFQSDTVSEQLKAARSVVELLPQQNLDLSKKIIRDDKVSMKEVVSNAIKEGISTEDIVISDDIELKEATQSQLMENDTIRDE